MEGMVGSDADMDELKAYNKAMEMNRQLKAMLEESQVEQEAPPARAPLRQHQQQRMGAPAPVPARKRAGACGGRAAVAAAGGGGRNFTFSEQKLNTMGRENQVLLERMQRIALSSGTGLSSQPVAASYRRKVGSNGINRKKKDRMVQSENMVRAPRTARSPSPSLPLPCCRAPALRAHSSLPQHRTFHLSRPSSSVCNQSSRPSRGASSRPTRAGTSSSRARLRSSSINRASNRPARGKAESATQGDGEKHCILIFSRAVCSARASAMTE